MKKLFCIAMVTVLCLSLCACQNTTGSTLQVKGTFIQHNDNEKSRILVVFDYPCGAENKTLPEETEKIFLTCGENQYKIASNTESISSKTGIRSKAFDNWERYLNYTYAQGAKVPANQDTIRLFASFSNVARTDLDATDTIILAVDNFSVEIKTNSFQSFNQQFDLLHAEEDYNAACHLASFKSRIDTAYSNIMGFEDLYGHLDYGSDFNYLSNKIKSTFGSTESSDAYPAFDADVIKKMYPEASEYIDDIVEGNNLFADCIKDSTKNKFDGSVLTAKSKVTDSYRVLCEILEMDVLIIG